MTVNAPKLDQLFARFLSQSTAQAKIAPEVPTSEVEPYKALPAAWVEPTAVWTEAVAAAKLLLTDAARADLDRATAKVPSEWVQLYRNREPQQAVPLCLGNVPQMLGDVNELLALRRGERLGAADTARRTTVPGPAPEMSETNSAETLVHVALLRLQQHLETADAVLDRLARTADAEYQPIIANERAALAWQQGDANRAKQLWNDPSLANHPVGAFNRGLVALCEGDAATARTNFRQAAGALSEGSSWHHLAQFYGTLAELI